MPSSLTHHIFAQDALPIISKVFPFIEQHKDLVAVGTQGPDLFFFYGMVPWRKRNDATLAHAAGSALHAMDPLDLFPPLWKKLASQPADLQELLASYLFGTMLHYLLDRTVHPYVFYRTGFDAQGALTAPFVYDHARLETAMDVAYVSYRKYNRNDYHPGKTLQANHAKMMHVGPFYAQLNLHGVQPHHWLNGWEDMMTIKNFMFSPHGVKYHLIKGLTGFDSMINANLYPNHVASDDPYDVLNLTKQVWKNPTTGESMNASVIELTQVALQQVEQMARLADQQWHAPDDDMTPRWHSFFRSIDHDGNFVGQKRRYFRSMYRPQMAQSDQ